MSEQNIFAEDTNRITRAWYKQEPWLAVCLACFVPVLAAIYVPVFLKMPLIVLGVFLLTISMGMLIRQLRAN